MIVDFQSKPLTRFFANRFWRTGIRYSCINKFCIFGGQSVLVPVFDERFPLMVPNKLIHELLKANLSPEVVGEILKLGTLLEVKNQTRLMEPGKICDKAYFILKGGFVCRYIDEALEIEKTINFFLDDFQPFMACVDSFFSGQTTRCELRAISPSVVMAFAKQDIEAHINRDLHLFRFYHSLVTTALQGENDFKLKIIAYSSEQLYEYLITHYPLLIQRVPARFIAEFMGISSEWLSKLKHRI